MRLSRDGARDVLERMLAIRRFEETAVELARAHPEVGRMHLYIGHEAIGAPIMMLLRPGDLVHTTHRNHGHVIARGADPARAFAELLGRAGGLCRGKAGSFHLCERTAGFGPTSALVGGSMGLAVGTGFALKKQDRDAVSVAMFGDGTLDEGISYEAFNVASLFELPVLFVCENNSTLEEHAQTSKLAAARLSDVPKALGVDVEIVDGADVDAVSTTVERVLERIRSTGRPGYVEARVERWPGAHQVRPELPTGITDLSLCWSGREVTGPHAEWIRSVDPVLRFVRTLLADGLLTQAEVAELDRSVQERMTSARAAAEASPFPRGEDALAAVFA